MWTYRFVMKTNSVQVGRIDFINLSFSSAIFQNYDVGTLGRQINFPEMSSLLSGKKLVLRRFIRSSHRQDSSQSISKFMLATRYRYSHNTGAVNFE